MISLTYIFHSGFLLDTDGCILVFDYWMDPAGIVRQCLNRAKDKPVYVFASHFHEDHFTREIFTWKDVVSCCTYILSKDILKRRKAKKEEADVWLAKGGTWEDEHIKVKATGSNDSGVSWIVEIDGKRIFHAGDLCNWYARFLEGSTPDKEIYSEEFGEYFNPVAEEKRYLGELKDVRKIADSFDLVMFPVDGRIGNGYTLGARQFIDRFKVGVLAPMHFTMSGFESAWRMLPFCQENGIPFWCIQHEGDCIALTNDDMIIRKSAAEDIPALLGIFAIARKFMAETGNPNQWAAGYPSENLLQQDISSGDSYVVQRGNAVVATFVLRGGNDPTYDVISEGAWQYDTPYATIHRIASNGQVKGILHQAMAFALQNYDSIRIDTHRDNQVMQSAIRKEGFVYCGIIHCWNGSERLAYQYTKPQR
jgi:hypothetical protein